MNNFTVLLFHSVDDRDLLSLRDLGNIHPHIFEKILRELREDFDIVSLDEIIRGISGGEGDSARRLLAITFDDGPGSYASRAVPVMKSLGIPSTCFLITDCVGDEAIYWRYLYNFCIRTGHEKELAALISAEYGIPVPADNIISVTRSHYVKEKNRRIIQRIFKDIADEKEYREKEPGLFLTAGEIQTLSADPLVTFGIHTRTHPVLMKLSEGEIFDEIEGSLGYCRTGTRNGSPMFSIPFGRLYKDYDERTIMAAKSLSIEVVMSAYGGSNNPGQPLYNVRRIPVNEDMLRDGPGSLKRELEKLCSVPEYAEKEKKLYNAIEGHKKAGMP